VALAAWGKVPRRRSRLPAGTKLGRNKATIRAFHRRTREVDHTVRLRLRQRVTRRPVSVAARPAPTASIFDFLREEIIA